MLYLDHINEETLIHGQSMYDFIVSGKIDKVIMSECKKVNPTDN